MKSKTALVLLLLAPALACAADGPGYRYVEAGATRYYNDSTGGFQPLRGAYIAGSIPLGERFYAFGELGRSTSGGESYFEEATEYYRVEYRDIRGQVGIGTHHALSDHTDVVLEAAYVRDNWRVSMPDFPNAIQDWNRRGGRASIGLRETLTSHLEGWLKVGYLRAAKRHSDFSNEHDGSVVGDAGLQLRITPRIGVVAGAQFMDDVTAYHLGVRAGF